MSQQNEQTFNVKAAAWTVGVHVVLLLLFILFKYSVPATAAPVVDMGMEVNLGTSDNGSGTDQPMDVEDPAAAANSNAARTTTRQAQENKELLNTDDPDAPAVKNTPSTNKQASHTNEQATTRNRNNTSQPQAPAAHTQQQQRPRYVYNGGTGRGGNSADANAPGSSEGNTTGNGDRGVPGGTPGASNYTGTPGSGNGGISHNLAHRNIIAFPAPDADFKEGGRVVIRITVNKAGNIINKQIVSASNAELRAIALRKVDKVRFNKSDDAPEEQFGNITFVFKTRS